MNLSPTDLQATLALLRIEGVGAVMAKKLINHCGSAAEVFNEKPQNLAKIDGIGSYLLKNLKNPNAFSQAETELVFIEQQKITPLFYQSENYPNKLKHCYDSPVLLFQSGNYDNQNPRILSIVGTRNVTSYGTQFCKELLADLAPLNPIIVSGFAYGVDICAHQAALENNLQTVGVLAHGLNQIYPKAHKKYVAAMEQNGGFLTEFWSNAGPERENFVMRNRIVAGMSEATIVIESAERGGSLITANMANDYNRDVFALPGRVSDKFSQGCNNLIRSQKANLITSAADLLYLLNWEIDEKPTVIQKQLFVELTLEEQNIYDFLFKKGKEQMDLIAIACDFPIYKLSSILLNLELKGVVRPLPGKMFEAI
jgi:DNA processing protein